MERGVKNMIKVAAYCRVSTDKDDQDVYKRQALITISDYTVVKAVVIKDGKTASRTVTQTYDIVNKKPARPLTTLSPGSYTRKIGDDVGFSTKFMPVANGTEIYYTISYDGGFMPDPTPNGTDTIKYSDGADIEIKGHTIIKAVAVNIFDVKSDIGIFEYIVTPEAPKAAPSATVSGNLPVVPITAVKGSTDVYKRQDNIRLQRRARRI